MARSMVSLGTDAALALPTIVRRVAFDVRSPPPSRAATSIWRISLANNLPRALSLAPFWCLIVAHLEWPDIRRGPPAGSGHGAGCRPTARDGTTPPSPHPGGRGRDGSRAESGPPPRDWLTRPACCG